MLWYFIFLIYSNCWHQSHQIQSGKAGMVTRTWHWPCKGEGFWRRWSNVTTYSSVNGVPPPPSTHIRNLLFYPGIFERRTEMWPFRTKMQKRFINIRLLIIVYLIWLSLVSICAIAWHLIMTNLEHVNKWKRQCVSPKFLRKAKLNSRSRVRGNLLHLNAEWRRACAEPLLFRPAQLG